MSTERIADSLDRLREQLDRLREPFEGAFTSADVPEGNDEYANVVDVLHAIAASLQRLGTNDAATNMGAIELLAMEIKVGMHEVASAICALAEAIAEK